MKTNVLVGKTITGMQLAADKEAIRFQTTDGDIVARCGGDCCSHTWVENIESTLRGFPAVVASAEDVEMPDLGDMPECEVVAYYGFRIVTDASCSCSTSSSRTRAGSAAGREV